MKPERNTENQWDVDPQKNVVDETKPPEVSDSAAEVSFSYSAHGGGAGLICGSDLAD